MNKYLALLLLPCIFLTACNPYKNFYKPAELSGDTDAYVYCDTPQVEQIPPKDTMELQADMFRKGYGIIGVSGFNIDIDQAPQYFLEKQAKEVKACIAIVMKQFTHTQTGFMPMTEFHQGQQYTLNTTGTATGQATYTNSSGYNVGNRTTNYNYGSTTTVNTPNYTTTTYVPFQQRMHDHVATYWVKLKPSKLGLLFDRIPDEMKLRLNIEKGILVRAVRDGSPADNAGFIGGDIIVGFNGADFTSQEALFKSLDENAGKNVTFTVRRLDKTLTKEVVLGGAPS